MPTNADLLKARFCKQYIPRLKEFLTDFDISERIIDGKRNTRDSLGMRFLLAKYDDLKNKNIIQKLKEDCHWKINNVTDKELLLAIEEFFYITTNQDNHNEVINTIEGHRNTLLFNLFKLGINVDDQKSIEDSTIFKIASYFGVKKDINELGKLYEPFEGFAYALTQIKPDEIGIHEFHNALRLFSCVRNGVVHPDYKYRGDELNHYHEFIIFTYIGYVLACRRVWTSFDYKKIEAKLLYYDKDEKKLKRNDKSTFFVASEDVKKFALPPEPLEIIVKPGHKINEVCCEGKNVKKITKEKYEIKICKYEPFTIIIKFDNGCCKFDGMLDCYSWFNYCNFSLPDEKELISIEYEAFSEGTKKLINEVSDAIKKNITGEVKEAIEHEMATLQPLIHLVQDRSLKAPDNKELEMSLIGILDKLSNIGSSKDQTQSQIKQIHLQIGSLHKRFLGKLDEFSDSLYDLKKRNIIIDEKVDTLLEFTKHHWKQVRVVLSWILCIIGITLFFYCLLSNGGINWMQYPLISSILFILSSFLIISPLLLCRNTQFYISKIWSKLGKGLFTKALISIVFGLIVLTSIYSYICSHRNSFVKDYNFAINKTEKNQKVVNLMESILETNSKDDEDVRVQLTRYFINYANDTEKALTVASPMLDDISKYNKGILALAEALYSQGKDYWKVRDLLDEYGKSAVRDTNIINRIQGIMCIWGQGRTSNVTEGNRLLKMSADNGDAEAQYYLGYSYSHEMTDWEQSKISKTVKMSEYDLAEAAYYLRKAAHSKPKAALELGILYSDLNINDSAEFYLKKAENSSSGILHKESLYRLGLLYEGTDIGTQYMMRAAILDYEPAILYKANKAKDHKSAIELYNRPGGYQGYRYILPITFNYLALKQRNKALETLQEGRPYGKFDMNFIRAMEAIIEAEKLKELAKTEEDSTLKVELLSIAHIDSVTAMNFMDVSAQNGCLYAEMICKFKEANIMGFTESMRYKLTEIAEEIPFAYVLLSYLAHKNERFLSVGLPNSDHYANQAIGQGNLAGQLMYVVPSYYENYISKSINKLETAVYHYNIRQRALRVNNEKRWNIIYGYKAETKIRGGKDSLSNLSKRFWRDVSRANNVDLNEVNLKHFVLPDISDMELLNEFSDKIIDKQKENPFIF